MAALRPIQYPPDTPAENEARQLMKLRVSTTGSLSAASVNDRSSATGPNNPNAIAGRSGGSAAAGVGVNTIAGTKVK